MKSIYLCPFEATIKSYQDLDVIKKRISLEKVSKLVYSYKMYEFGLSPTTYYVFKYFEDLSIYSNGPYQKSSVYYKGVFVSQLPSSNSLDEFISIVRTYLIKYSYLAH